MSSMGPLRIFDGGAMLEVWVVPGAARTELRGLHDGALRVRVAAPASGGQANRALVRFLQKTVGCPTTLAKGGGGRRKQVRIESTDLDAIAEMLGIGNG